MGSLLSLISNRLEPDRLARPFAAILGDHPSQYAKSPSIWNPTFRALEIDAIYLSFDVEPQNLPELLAVLRKTETFLGANVTVPYKVAILKHLDGLDEKARLIGAVNTVVRTSGGQLLGYNTDGQGGLDSLTKAAPGQPEPFLETLAGTHVVLLGAGGAGRALAFYLAEAIGDGQLTIVNRDAERARSLAGAVRQAYGNASAWPATALKDKVRRAALIINATTCGQSGLRSAGEGQFTCLEPYSPLAPANPVSLAPQPEEERAFYAAWALGSRADILRNQAESFTLLSEVPVGTAVFDIIYSPLETTLIRQARLTGHRTLNGKGMNIAQAADALFNRVLRAELLRRGLHNEATYARVLEVMHSVW
jgi:shikimate dehydrogenase